MTLPAHVGSTLEAMLHGVSRTDLAQRAERLSLGYRAADRSARVITSAADALAYSVARMPATYAAVSEALARIVERSEAFHPRSLLDLGSGPGTAAYAALEHWPGIGHVTMLEGNAHFRELAKAICTRSALASLEQAALLPADLRDEGTPWPAADLVTAAYVLVELSESETRQIVRKAYDACGHGLLFVEPGTPAGFARCRQARDVLLALGATPLAPCTHAHPCPIITPDWCHFSVRLARSRDHKLAKGADAPYEDERFSYIAVTRERFAYPDASRVISAPHASKADVSLRLCGTDGITQRHIPRRRKLDYKAAKDLGWGDLVDDTPP
jgi:ribosomal protein RSM22 (predicted rRNA methylase)